MKEPKPAPVLISVSVTAKPQTTDQQCQMGGELVDKGIQVTRETYNHGVQVADGHDKIISQNYEQDFFVPLVPVKSRIFESSLHECSVNMVPNNKLQSPLRTAQLNLKIENDRKMDLSLLKKESSLQSDNEDEDDEQYQNLGTKKFDLKMNLGRNKSIRAIKTIRRQGFEFMNHQIHNLISNTQVAPMKGFVSINRLNALTLKILKNTAQKKNYRDFFEIIFELYYQKSGNLMHTLQLFGHTYYMCKDREKNLNTKLDMLICMLPFRNLNLCSIFKTFFFLCFDALNE